MTSVPFTTTIAVAATDPPAIPAVAPVPTPQPTYTGGISPGRVSISFLCNVPSTQRIGYCHAVFSYENTHAEDRTLRIGAENYGGPGPLLVDIGQREVFNPGVHYGGAYFTWDCSAHSFVRWTLHDGDYTSSVGVGRATRECPPVNR